MSGVGIWRPAEVGGAAAFVRPPPGPFGDHHAAREVIPAAKPPGTRRVCWFGESAAAGYLYAPHVTPARMLQQYLGDTWDVVDLARTNETLDGLAAAVAAAAHRLDPDVLVVFTGNNWNLLETPEVSPYYPSAAGRTEYAAALREAGLAGPIELAGRRRLRRAGEALAALAAHGLPVVLVVPEANAADWEARQPVPWLPGGGTAAWHRHHGAAVAALAKGDEGAAREAAERMLDIDGGLTPAPFRILAATGVPGAAEAEVAADHYATMCFLGSPRAAPVDQEVQRRAARRHGFRLVDLPAVFRRHEPLPGRQLFLDYCHLTAAGMRLAVAAVAAEVAGRDVASVDVAVAPAVEATARLGAAIHAAHRHLPVDPRNDAVARSLRAALAADPSVAGAMLDVAAARAAPVPEVLTPAQQRNLASPHRLGYAHGWRFDHLDAVLLEAMAGLLGRDVDAALAPRAVGERPVELVRPSACLWEPSARFHHEVTPFADVTVPVFLRCPWPAASLAFVAAAPADHAVEVTARLPGYGAPGQATLIVNGKRLGRLPIGRAWSSASRRVPAAAVRPGLNRLDVWWPELPPVGDEQLAGVVDRLERGLPADLHPVFGELWSARVHRAG